MKLILTILFSFFFIQIKTSEYNTYQKSLEDLKIRLAYEKLVKAIYLQESSGNPEAVGKDNDFGLFQITPIRLKDFNQRTGKNYTSDDLFNPMISREIFDYYAYRIGLENHEEIAKKWNTWHGKGEKAEEYWEQVEKRFNKLI